MDQAQAEPQATEAGREALIKTVANLTGVTVDHYAEIGLLGFSLITDALGGVNVCLKDPVYEPLSGADFPAGWQKLDGPQALSFVRQRHDLPRGDLDRVVRQQAVMASLAHEVISSKTLSSPATLNRLEDAVQRSVVLSDGWDIMEFVEQLQKLAAGNVAFATIPCSRRTAGATTACRAWYGSTPARSRIGSTACCTTRTRARPRNSRTRRRRPPPTWSTTATSTGLPPRSHRCWPTRASPPGTSATTRAGHVTGSQVQAAKADDLGAQAISKELGGLPIVEDSSVARARCGSCWPPTTPGPAPGSTAATRRWRPPTRRQPDADSTDDARLAVADHHRRLQRPAVRQLT